VPADALHEGIVLLWPPPKIPATTGSVISFSDLAQGIVDQMNLLVAPALP
jgi:hypothetical protein